MLDVGDWLYFDNMGAYTNAIGTEFNGFTKSVIHHVFSAAMQFDMSLLPKDFPNLNTQVDAMYNAQETALNGLSSAGLRC